MGKKSQGYSLWKTKNYKLTLKKDNGEELYIKGTRAPNLERGMRVEIRLHEAKSMDPIVVSVNGNETEIYQRECAVTDIEKIVVFMICLIISSLMIKSLNRQYVIKGNRQ